MIEKKKRNYNTTAKAAYVAQREWIALSELTLNNLKIQKKLRSFKSIDEMIEQLFDVDFLDSITFSECKTLPYLGKILPKCKICIKKTTAAKITLCCEKYQIGNNLILALWLQDFFGKLYE